MKTTGFPSIDPYQILFPLGLLHALIGGSAWILFAFQLVPYPGQLHSHHMFVGFLLSFAAGFLLTAIPRFTGAARCSAIELSVVVGLSTISLFFANLVMGLVILLFIAVFFGRRLARRTFTPPPHFIFLPIGLIMGIAGACIASLVQFGVIDSRYFAVARLFLYYGTMLSFLLGIGAKLISALLGWAPLPTHRVEPPNSLGAAMTFRLTNKMTVPLIQAAIFLSGFVIEVLSFPSAGRGLRAVCATWIAMQNWRLYRLPRSSGKFPFWIWIAAWMLLSGLWVHSIFASLEIHAAHLIFIGGYALMTLMIASRVSLAHGGHSLKLELTSRIFAITGVLMIVVVLTRFSAQWTPSYATHLAYAATIWIVVICFWGAFFLPRIFFRSKNNGDSNEKE